MSEPVRVAFCPIFFEANGGRLAPNGRPIFEEGVRGLCNKPWDCGLCSFMHAWLDTKMAEGWEPGWECVHCLKTTKRSFCELSFQHRLLPGYYQSGRREGSEVTGLSGCTRCGWESDLLQLVLRKMKGSR